MTNVNRNRLRQQLLEEILEEMGALQGKALDDYLTEVGLEPKALLSDFANFLALSRSAVGRKRFEAARTLLASAKPRGKILDFDPSRKRLVFAAVKNRMAATGDMMIAARNQKIESEEDLETFLDACFELGVIDENGDLKD
jgi:hypothetical protein